MKGSLPFDSEFIQRLKERIGGLNEQCDCCFELVALSKCAECQVETERQQLICQVMQERRLITRNGNEHLTLRFF